MLTPYGSDLAYSRICDRRAQAVPRREHPGRARIAIGRALIGAGARLTRSSPAMPSLVRRVT